jgi:putative protease
MMTRRKYEIMAPVGSWESLQAAVQAGADSVYFGIDKLNMRSQSMSILRSKILPGLWKSASLPGLRLI